MAVVIRMQRAGTTNRPFWHVVAADRRMRRDGRFIEKLGHYDPVPDPPVIELDVEKIDGWIRKGAQPSDKVRSLINRVKNPESVRVRTKKAEKPAAKAAGEAPADKPGDSARKAGAEAAVATEAPPAETGAKAEAASEAAAEETPEAPVKAPSEGETPPEDVEKKTDES